MVIKNAVLSTDYSKSPLVTFNLSDTHLLMRVPPHESTYTPIQAPSNLDIYAPDTYQEKANLGILSRNLLNYSWNYMFKDLPYNAGTIMVAVTLWKVPIVQNKINSLLNPSNLNNIILSFSDSLFRDNNDELIKQRDPNLDEQLWIYPKQEEDLHSYNVNGNNWIRYKDGHPSMPRLTYWFSNAITKDHLINVGINLTGFLDEQIGSPEGVDTLLERLIQEFFEHFHIQYTPETLAEMELYK
ncbi:hypothetical protein [Hahella sp. HN01]|uniref:hypothetical protein n=1 Tax=Hahella sp. HN01 TaxID=2847262 RepID=UPI001C1EDEE2|nr:hypothetical protein [Hahella sp. HN01]MBU6952140.1 hypothetical protein [Hahella sp. HN01]